MIFILIQRFLSTDFLCSIKKKNSKIFIAPIFETSIFDFKIFAFMIMFDIKKSNSKNTDERNVNTDSNTGFFLVFKDMQMFDL
jgi:hypothetical protein